MKIDEIWLERWTEKIEENLSGRAILEIGCGEGRDTRVLSAYNTPIVAVDISHNRLRKCVGIKGCFPLQVDIEKGLPFADSCFSIILASLSLHYFLWSDTIQLMKEIQRIATTDAFFLIRLNSVRDANFGAGAGKEIEKNYYYVSDKRKRFFDEGAVQELLVDFSIEYLKEKTIDRYEKAKVVWEIAAHAPSR